MKRILPNSVDAIVTDPPYGLSFMGKKWDYDVPSVEIWREVFRVLKPGGHVLSFGGTRTYHRMVVNIEDAGFEVRDCVTWHYGQGFPKSHNISKAIDKMAGVEREVVGSNGSRPIQTSGRINAEASQNGPFDREENLITSPATPEAKQWDGWGSALKPSTELIVLARKPLEKGLTLAENVLKYGTGGLNIDGCRIGTETRTNSKSAEAAKGSGKFGEYGAVETQLHNYGRWPANLILDETAAELLDFQSGSLKSGSNNTRKKPHATNAMAGVLSLTGDEEVSYGDSGGASRFFYVAKSSKRDRNSSGAVINTHPTCKPTKLMEYLCKLITPPKGTILDPFTGSGSTGVAAVRLGFNFIGIEMNEEYVEIAQRRIANV